MILPERRSRYYQSKPVKRKPPLLLIIVLIIIAVIAFFLFRNMSSNSTVITNEQDMFSLWDQQKYEEVNTVCEQKLIDNPMDIEALTLNGFAYFYRGITKFTLEDQLPLFDKAILNLRKADIPDNSPYKSQIKYILGKAYYNKGKYYADLSIKYLESAISMDYSALDLFEYLGLAYHSIGDYEMALEYLLKAKDNNPSDMLYLAIGQTYVIAKDYENAIVYLKSAIEHTEDQSVIQKGHSLLGQLYIDQKDYDAAIEQYEQILKINTRSADAYYHLGVIYDTIGEKVHARAQWRKALEIEPTHHGALLKLYN